MATSTLPPRVVTKPAVSPFLRYLDSYFSRFTAESSSRWDPVSIGALFSLVVIWAAWVYGTWADWGSVTVDCGREMYVPSLLAQGKVLYRDVWYLYSPLAPYLNAVLFRMFGVHLTVLYCAGALSALGSAILLYLAGKQMSSWVVGWTAGAVLLAQAFPPSFFSFPLPYSYASVYGCLTACFFLWAVLRASLVPSPKWIFAAAGAAAVALLLKLEFGVACYGTLALLIAARAVRQDSPRQLLQDVALTLPGLGLCAFVARWMVSIGGVQFLTQENLMSWPTSYFMRTYGKFWLASTGLSITPVALAGAAERTFLLVGVAQGIHLLFRWKDTRKRVALLRLALLMGCLAYLTIHYRWFEVARQLFFPQDTVLYVTVAAVLAWWAWWRQPASGTPTLALLLTFSSLLAGRLLLNMRPSLYSIYYDGPAVLSLLLLVRLLWPPASSRRRFMFRGEVLIGLLCLGEVLSVSRQTLETPWKNDAYLVTDRGTIKLTKSKVEQYTAAINFMKAKRALGQTVMSVPEDVSLYFFSGMVCPTRVFEFTPGVVAPGKMTDETLRQIQRGNVRYLIWSNRLFPEYPTLRWGTDFDQPLGDYLRSHYRLLGPLRPGRVRFGEWTAFIWERKSDADSR